MDDFEMTAAEMQQETAEEQLAAVRPIEVITEEIQFYKQQAGAAVLMIGQRLIEAKEQLTHGEWLPWLQEKVEFSEASAQRFMRLAREYQNPSPVTDLGASKALILLALPASEREDFVAEKHPINGKEKTVAEMSKRELEQAIRERDEARRQLEEERAANEGTALKLANMDEMLQVAKNRAEGYEKKLQLEADRAAEAVAAAEKETAELREELEALRAKPQDVAVQTVTVVDQKAVEAAKEEARQEAEKKLTARIEKAEKAKEKAEKEKAAAEQEMAAVKISKEQAETVAAKEKQAMEEQMRDLQKRLAVASSSEIAIFKLHFEQCQGSVNKMGETIRRMEEAGDAESAGKLKNAAKAVLLSALESLK